MTDTLAVIVGDVIAGAVTRLASGKLQFTYDEQYATMVTATPLSLSRTARGPCASRCRGTPTRPSVG